MHARTGDEQFDAIYVFPSVFSTTAENRMAYDRGSEMSHLAQGTSAGGAFGQHRSWSFLLMLLLFCGGCSEVRDSHELLHSLLWMRTSAEYHVLSVMTYQRARTRWIAR